MDAKQFKKEIVVPTLKKIGRYSANSANLIMGTVWQESHGDFIKQLGKGPALGFIQMEPATHDDIWENYLAYHSALAKEVSGLALEADQEVKGYPNSLNLMLSLPYQVAMCRCHYLRKKPAIPAEDDVEGMANYWKKYYNTHLGAGKPEEFIENFPMEVL